MKRLFIIPIFILLYSFLCFSQANEKITFNIKLFLQGPYNNNVMSNELSKENLTPLYQPYNRKPWDYNGKEHVIKIPENIVDWVLVELTNDTNRSKLIAEKAAFITSNGMITSLDGRSPLTFENINVKKCYLIIYHRNHLPIMSGEPVTIRSSVDYDFTIDKEKAFGNSSIDLGNGVFGMISGDSDSNGEINNQDFKVVAANLLKIGYINADLDMNGVVNVLDYKKTNINLSKKTAFR